MRADLEGHGSVTESQSEEAEKQPKEECELQAVLMSQIGEDVWRWGCWHCPSHSGG
jgi:hypothetical protein